LKSTEMVATFSAR